MLDVTALGRSRYQLQAALEAVVETVHENTYIKPVANMAAMPAFCFGAICKWYVAHIGSTRIRISERTLREELKRIKALLLRQWPPLWSGFQIFSWGTHSKIKVKRMLK